MTQLINKIKGFSCAVPYNSIKNGIDYRVLIYNIKYAHNAKLTLTSNRITLKI